MLKYMNTNQYDFGVAKLSIHTLDIGPAGIEEYDINYGLYKTREGKGLLYD